MIDARSICTGAALLLVAGLAAPAEAVVYALNFAGGGLSASGSITTDGTIGTLGSGNIVDWTFDLDDGFDTFTLDGPSNSVLLLVGNGLVASPTALSFNFSGPGLVLFQNPALASGINFVCLTGSFVCGGFTNGVSVTVSNFGGGIARRGVQQVGTAVVPEPASWALMIVGFGAVGSAMRRRPAMRTTVRFG